MTATLAPTKPIAATAAALCTQIGNGYHTVLWVATPKEQPRREAYIERVFRVSVDNYQTMAVAQRALEKHGLGAWAIVRKA